VKSAIYKREVIAARGFPELSWRWVDEKPILSGKYHFCGEKDGVELSDDFDLRIEFPASYPRHLPIVSETSGTIHPKYHHIQNASLCLGTEAELYMIFSKIPCLVTFMNEFVNPYLFRWLTIQHLGHAPWIDRAHGLKGIIEGYCHILQLEHARQVFESLRFILSNRDYRQNHPCPCGSGEKTKQCHRKRFEHLVSLVPMEVMQNDYSHFLVAMGRR